MGEVDFKGIFQSFLDHEKTLKVVFVASCDPKGKPNSAPKMLVDVESPDKLYFLEYMTTKTKQ